MPAVVLAKDVAGSGLSSMILCDSCSRVVVVVSSRSRVNVVGLVFAVVVAPRRRAAVVVVTAVVWLPVPAQWSHLPGWRW